MPALPYIAAVAAALVVDGYVKSEDARNEMKKSQERQRVAQEGIQSEQRATNASQALKEKIRQRREFLRKSAIVRQASMNTGTSGSSGETAALASLETGLSLDVAANAGAKRTGESISSLAQDNANAAFDFQSAGMRKEAAGQEMGLGMSLFSMSAGSLNSPSGSPSPPTTPTSGSSFEGFDFDPNNNFARNIA